MERSATEWTPARMFLAFSAIYHLFLGGVGLAIDQTFPFSPEAALDHSEHIFGLFETNGWHSLAAVLVGVASLYGALRPRFAREIALTIGISHIAVTASLALVDPSVFLFASNAADQAIHTFTAISGLATGLATPSSRGSDVVPQRA
jgi:hypothetical protein